MPLRQRGPESGDLQAFQVVLAWVDEQILGGHLRIGDRLPAERDLADQLRVSRTAVREAVRTLQAQGVVRSVGAGRGGRTELTEVHGPALSRLLQLNVALSSFPLPDVVEVRVALERLSARLAATHATPEQLTRLEELVLQMRGAADDRERYNDLDTQFHLTLAAAAGNTLATALTEAIRESLRLPIRERFRALLTWDQVVPLLQAEHETIYAAVSDGDAALAERLTEGHIRAAWARINPAEEQA